MSNPTPRLEIDKWFKRSGIKSKNELGKRMGVAPKNTRRFFRAGYNPRFGTLIKLAEAFGCKIRDLIKE